MTVYYGERALSMTYSDEELNKKIGIFIQDRIKEGHKSFSYKALCYVLFREAQEEKCLLMDNGAVYNNPVMADADATRISLLLWQRIWNREIFIDFHENKYATNYHDDTRFGII